MLTTFDTSGIICGVPALGCTCDFDWSTLGPFARGYIEAMLSGHVVDAGDWLKCR